VTNTQHHRAFAGRTMSGALQGEFGRKGRCTRSIPLDDVLGLAGVTDQSLIRSQVAASAILKSKNAEGPAAERPTQQAPFTFARLVWIEIASGAG
jgi:hypothetical protein